MGSDKICSYGWVRGKDDSMGITRAEQGTDRSPEENICIHHYGEKETNIQRINWFSSNFADIVASKIGY